ncbi:MAG: hypothetical protein U1D31_00605 [Patescibacteria group bacterium]|nr:hypothetical protein [Patescibacteria group bacterium]
MFGKGREASSREFDSFAHYGTNRDGTGLTKPKKIKKVKAKKKVNTESYPYEEKK